MMFNGSPVVGHRAMLESVAGTTRFDVLMRLSRGHPNIEIVTA